MAQSRSSRVLTDTKRQGLDGELRRVKAYCGSPHPVLIAYAE
jgi:hypothetical protein